MQNIILIVHLILAVSLIAVVLLQRSEGGALGIGGGGGGGGGLVSSRGAATALSKLTWVIGVGFLCTSIALTIVSDGGQGGSLLNELGGGDEGALPLPAPVQENQGLPALPNATLPPTAD